MGREGERELKGVRRCRCVTRLTQEILREEMGEDITVSNMAAHLGVRRVTLIRLLNGSAGITANMAIRLAEAFPKTDARFWMTL